MLEEVDGRQGEGGGGWSDLPETQPMFKHRTRTGAEYCCCHAGEGASNQGHDSLMYKADSVRRIAQRIRQHSTDHKHSLSPEHKQQQHQQQLYFLSCQCARPHSTDQYTISNSISNSLLPVMSVRKAVKLTKQPTRPPSRSGLFLPELGVPTTRSSLPLYRRSSTLKAASTVTNRLLPQRCANRLSCTTPFTGMVTCASTITPEPVIFSQQV